jgi:hypothetical protein
MDEKSTEQRKRGVFSGREIFYFFFALLVFGAAMLAFSLQSSGWRGKRAQERAAKRDTKLARAREVMRAIYGSGGYVFSDSEVFYHDNFGGRSNRWLIYDLKKDEIRDGHELVRPLDKAGVNGDALTNSGWLSGWNGNLVYTAEDARNREFLIFQWRTNSDEPRVVKWKDIKGRNPGTSAPHMLAVENGWLDAVAYNQSPNGIVHAAWAGNLDGLMPLTDLVLTNLNKTNLVASNPFRRDLYITVATADNLHADIYILSLTNRSLIFSNDAVRMPRAFDHVDAEPDPSGRRVLWRFVVESKINAKLRSFLPDAVAPKEAPTRWYLYSSDLHAAEFHYICLVQEGKNSSWRSPGFLWGPNGGSIWLLDWNEGIRRFELK